MLVTWGIYVAPSCTAQSTFPGWWVLSLSGITMTGYDGLLSKGYDSWLSLPSLGNDDLRAIIGMKPTCISILWWERAISCRLVMWTAPLGRCGLSLVRPSICCTVHLKYLFC